MSETAKRMFDSLKDMAPGLKNFGPEVGAELSRLGVQGQMELASALFNGNGFVPYGPGQYTPSPEHTAEQAASHAPDHMPEQHHELSRGR